MELIRNGGRARRALTIAAAAAALALVVGGCAATGDYGGGDEGGSSDGASITFIPKNLNNPYRGRARHHQLEHVPGRRLQAGQPDALGCDDPQKAIDHHFACIDVMNETGSSDLKIWLADGTNYPGQDDMRARQDRLADSLADHLRTIGENQRLVLEYKFFEPAFYHMDVPDWGTSYAQVPRWATAPWSASTPATTRPARTSSSS